MTYVIDTNSFMRLGNYYPSRFPTLWGNVTKLVADMQLISTREVRNELAQYSSSSIINDWVNENKNIFLIPSADETKFINKIFSIPHFHQLISRENILKGRPVADPFVVALAAIKNCFVVTEEKIKPNAAKIPNVCEKFKIKCIDLEEMMKIENWVF